MKRKFTTIMLILSTLIVLTIPACAWGGYTSWFWRPFWQPGIYAPETDVTDEEAAEEEETITEDDATEGDTAGTVTDQDATGAPAEITLTEPEITTHTYCHTNAAYSGFDNTLQVVWDEVDGAESYEVEITKADGSSKVYTTTGACLLIKAGSDEFITGCPKVYVEETSTWTAATVRVRAVAGDAAGGWSQTEKISCNALVHKKE